MDTASDFQRLCAQDRDDDTLFLPTWSVQDWEALFACCATRHVPAGSLVIQRGERERALYFVASGALVAREPDGVLYHEHPGSVFGEVAFFDGRPRSVSVYAVRHSRLLRIDHEGLLAFARVRAAEANALLMALGRVLAFRLRRAEHRAGPATHDPALAGN